MNAQIIWQGKKTVGGIMVDAFIQESHSSSTQVTTLPVEDGATITDHAVNMPDQLSLTGVIGDVDIIAPFSDSTRPARLYDQLQQLRLKRQPLEVVTGLKVYSNMLITGFNVDRSAENSIGLEFTMQLQQIDIVTSQRGSPNSKLVGSTASVRQVQSTASTGSASTTTVSATPPVRPLDVFRNAAGIPIQ